MQKLLIVTPHLSTGGLPQYLLWQLTQLRITYDIFLVEYKCISDIYTVQRKKILELIPPNNFLTLTEPQQLLKVIADFQPNLLYFQEFPERFCDVSILPEIYQRKGGYAILETTHSSEIIQKQFFPDKFIFVSSYSCEMYRPLDVPYQLVEYPIVKKSSPTKTQALQKLGLSANKKHVLSVGLFTPDKNQKEAFELAALLPEIEFHFIGNMAENYADYWRPLLEAKPDNCFVHGEQENVNDWYAACNALLFTSNFELNPLVVKEAIGWDMPILMKNLLTYQNQYAESPKLRFLTNDKNKNAQLLKELLDGKLPENRVIMGLEQIPTEKPQIDITFHFVNGPRVEIDGNSKQPFQVTFLNKTTGLVDYETVISNKSFAKCLKEYYQDWQIVIKQRGKELFNYHLDLKNQHVLISLTSSALGDNLAWFPYIEEFRKRHKCRVTCSTYFNELFEQAYPLIRFVKPATIVDNIFAQYKIGCFNIDDRNLTPVVWYKQPLQGIARHQLGLQDLGEIRPKIHLEESQDIHKNGGFVCIATESTLRCKEWQNPTGWQSLVRWLRSKNLQVINISHGGKLIEGAKNVAKDEPLSSIISYLKHSKFLVGLPSGLSWLAWALNKQVVMISGFSEPWCEFQEGRIHVGPPEGTCKGCFQKHLFNPNNWDWCPEKKNFECTKSISVDMVKEKIQPLL